MKQILFFIMLLPSFLLGQVFHRQGSFTVREYTTDTIWHNSSCLSAVIVICIGGGGSGGSGRRGAAGTVRCGGGGGSAGTIYFRSFTADMLPATVSVTVPAGVAGAPSVTIDDTSGSDGADGGATSFGSYLEAPGGISGKAGTTATSSAGGSAQGTRINISPFWLSFGSPAGGNGMTTNNGQNGPAPLSSSSHFLCSGGGGGGGFPVGNTLRNGGLGGRVRDNSGTLAGGGSAGDTGGTRDGGNGTTNVNTAFLLFAHSLTMVGLGGGGGGGATGDTAGTISGGNGGHGAVGGGGGGGGGATNGANSGAGGNGGAGLCIVIEFH